MSIARDRSASVRQPHRDHRRVLGREQVGEARLGRPDAALAVEHERRDELDRLRLRRDVVTDREGDKLAAELGLHEVARRARQTLLLALRVAALLRRLAGGLGGRLGALVGVARALPEPLLRA
jgi:hypothetical protein